MVHLERVGTGIKGLDKMLNGGLIPNRPYLLSGPTSTGKTTLCLHFLLEGIRNNESVLFVALDEPPNEIKHNVESFGWNLDDIKLLDATPDVTKFRKMPSIIDVGTVLDVKDMKDISEIRKTEQLRLREVTLHSVQKMLRQEYEGHLEYRKTKYSRIVIDSMTALKLFGMKGEDWKKYIQSFFRFLAELEVTSLIVTSQPLPDALDSEFILARGDLRLYKWHDPSTHEIRRGISIEKFRGSPHEEAIRPLLLTESGLGIGKGSVKLHQKRRGKKPKGRTEVLEFKPGKKLKFGIRNLDLMLHGGLIPGRAYIISGAPGTGKTILSSHFLLEGLRNHENVLFVALEEPVNEIKANLMSFDWQMDDMYIIDANSDIRKPDPTPILEISSESLLKRMADIPLNIRKSNDLVPFYVTAHMLIQMLKQEFNRRRYHRIVFDSLTALKYFCMEDFEVRNGIRSFIRFLAEMKVTALLTLETPEDGRIEFENMLARGEIRLQKVREGAALKRTISIEKFKGSSHDSYVHPMTITENGIHVV
jgi:KaiC/GvpD/RAD55 family RecA-like ATPase